MKKLRVYLIKEFLTFFFGALFFFVLLVTIADMSSRLEHYAQNPSMVMLFIKYHLYRAPHNMYYIFPIALMFSATFVLGNFVKNKEMLAVQNSGVSLFQFSSPMFVIVIILCVSLVGFWQFVAAPLNKEVFSTNDIIYGRSSKQERTGISFFGNRGYVYFVDRYRFPDSSMINATIIKINEQGKIETRISAARIKWDKEKEKWIANNALVVSFQNNISSELNFTNGYELDVTERPEHFQNQPLLDSMTLTEEANLIKLRKAINMNTARLETDLNYRISYSFSGFVVVMVAALFCRFSTHSVLVVSLVLVIVVSLLYYSVLMFFRSLGEINIINPVISAWMPNLLFIVGCLIAFALE